MTTNASKRMRNMVLSVLAALIISCGVLFFVSRAFAETKKSLEDETKGGSFTAVMMKGSEPVTSPATLNYGDELFLEFDWTFPDTTVIEADEVLEYSLPSAIVFEEVSDKILKGTDEVGSYTIQNNKISVTYTSEKFRSGTGRSSSLVIAGKINGAGVSPTERSKVKIDLPGNVSYELDVVPPSAEPAMELTKTFENSKTQSERDAHIYDCYITVNMLGEHENPFIADDMYPGMSVYGDTVDLCTDPNYLNPYGGIYTFDINAAKDSFRMNLDGTFENRRFYVHYRVQVRDEMYAADTAKAFAANYPNHYAQGYEGRIPNYAYAKSAKMTEDAHVWANIYTLESPFEKWANDSENDEEKGLLSWSFFIEKMADSVMNAYIVDNIPPNNSVVISSMRIHNSTDPDLTPVTDYLLIKEYTEDGQKKLKITFTDAFLKVLKDHSMEITFFTKVERQLADTDTYTNSASLFIDGANVADRAMSMNYTKPMALKKENDYRLSTAPKVHYTVTVNPASLDLDSSKDEFTLVDTLGTALDIDLLSLKVNGAAPTAAMKANYDPKTRKLTLQLKDQNAYVIRYDAIVNLTANSVFSDTNGVNDCEIEGLVSANNGKPSKLTGTVFKSAASASSTDKEELSVRIVKHDAVSTMKSLPGAVFTLERVTEFTSGEATGTEKISEGIVTDENGQAEIKDLVRGEVYLLTETKAPAGYEKLSAPLAFAFSDGSALLPARFSVNGKDVSVEKIDASMNSKTIYVENEVTTEPETSTEAEETSTEAEETSTEAEETSTEVEETSTEAEETTTEAEETTTEAEETTTEAEETSTEAEETSTEAEETSTEVEETTTEAEETSTETEKTSTEAEETSTEAEVTSTQAEENSADAEGSSSDSTIGTDTAVKTGIPNHTLPILGILVLSAGAMLICSGMFSKKKK